jgi:hypothetical protein
MDENAPSDADSTPPPDEFVVHDDLSPEHHLAHDGISHAEANRDDLDANQIKKVAHRRRAAYRSRGYLLIGSIFSASLGVQLVWNSVGRFRGGYNVIAAAYLMAAAILFALAWRALGRAKELKREADASTLSDPKTPPDFSQLGDGSQSWKNLEDL